MAWGALCIVLHLALYSSHLFESGYVHMGFDPSVECSVSGQKTSASHTLLTITAAFEPIALTLHDAEAHPHVGESYSVLHKESMCTRKKSLTH
eukprot:6487591-Amphidinium_carterae.2